MLSELETVSVKPTQYFGNYFDMLSFLNIEAENVDKITLYFKRKGGSFEIAPLLNLKEKFNFPPSCKIITKDKKTQLYKFDYSYLEQS
jgi:hypothetical protein